MTPIRAIVLGGVGYGAILLGASLAFSQEGKPKTNMELLQDLQIQAPPASRNVTIPTPDSSPVETGSTSGDEGAAALKNLKEEEALRLNREILERLP